MDQIALPKKTDRLVLMETLTRVAHRKSLSAAADDMGVSKATVSRQIQELEDRLEIQLIRRNTHAVTITPAGLALLPDANQLLDNWDHISEKHSPDGTVNVTLKIVAPVGFGQFELVDVMSEYLNRNLNVSVVWQLINGDINFYEEGCDLWLCLGPPSDESLIVKRVGSLTSAIVCSSKYKYCKVYEHPSELEALPSVALDSFLRGVLTVHHKSGESYSFKPPPRFTTNNFPAMYRATLAGLGFAALPYWFIKEDLISGGLVNMLPEWTFDHVPLNLAYAPSRYQSSMMMDVVMLLMEKIPAIEGIERA